MGLESIAKTLDNCSDEDIIPLAEHFSKAMDLYLLDAGKENNRLRTENRRVAFNPSNYYKCIREVYYVLSGTPKGLDRTHALGERWLHVGTALHNWVQNDVIAKMSEAGGYDLQTIPPKELAKVHGGDIKIIEEHDASPIEIKYLDSRFTENIPISGMIDGAFTFKGRDILFEFKTINPTKFEYLVQPLPEHRAQGALYALSFNLPVMFLYLCKGTQKWVPYLINYSETQLDWVKKRLTTIEGFVKKQEVPPIKYDKEKCKYCEFKKQCRKDGRIK